MMRTQEEIKRICDEIKMSVDKVIEIEYRLRAKRKFSKKFAKYGKLIAKHSDAVMPNIGMVMAAQAITMREIIDRNPTMKRQLEAIMTEHKEQTLEELVERL